MKLNHHYAYPEDPDLFTVERLSNWIDQFLQGKLQRTFVSAPIPSQSQSTPHLRFLNLDNFEKEVINNDKDFLILFHNEGCGACQKFYKVWNQLINLVKSSNSLVLGQADGWGNDFDFGEPILGLPDIRFFASNDKKNPQKFNKEIKSLENIIQFIKDHSTSKFIHDEL